MNRLHFLSTFGSFAKRVMVLAVVILMGTASYALDFAIENADGVTIYYAWVQYEKDLAVTYCSDKTQKYSGTVIIPETANRGAWQYSVTSIGQEAFSHCRDLNSIVIPNSVKNIYSQAFYDCSHLESITIPNSVTNIGESAFGACGFTSVTIPNSVTNIGTGAFQWCIYLTSVTIPNSVKSMGEGIFYGCSGLTTIVSEIENPFAVADNLFYCDNINIYDTATLIVPVGKVSVYQSKAGWKKFKKIYEVVQIGEEFAGTTLWTWQASQTLVS